MKKATFMMKNSSTYPYGKDILSMLEGMTTDKLPIPVYFKQGAKRMEFYAEDVKKEKAIAFLPTADEDTLSLLQEIERMDASYKIHLTSCKGCKIFAEIEADLDKPTIVTIASNPFTELKKEIVGKGLITMEDIDTNINIMETNRVHGSLIEQVLKSYKPRTGELPKRDTWYLDPTPKDAKSTLFERIMLRVLARIPTILEGDLSTGKTLASDTAARCGNLTSNHVNLSRYMDPDVIYGPKSTDNTASSKLTPELASEYSRYLLGARDVDLGMISEYELYKAKAASVSIIQQETPFVKWLREGGMLVFDEMNMVEANFFQSFANPILDGTGYLNIPGLGKVNVHPNCLLFGTQNADYTGTMEQNSATKSRFACIRFPHPESIIRQLKAVIGEGRLKDVYFTQADNYYRALLHAVHKGDVNNMCLNIRGMIRAMELCALVPGVSTLAENIEMEVINTCPEYDRSLLIEHLYEIVTV